MSEDVTMLIWGWFTFNQQRHQQTLKCMILHSNDQWRKSQETTTTGSTGSPCVTPGSPWWARKDAGCHQQYDITWSSRVFKVPCDKIEQQEMVIYHVYIYTMAIDTLRFTIMLRVTKWPAQSQSTGLSHCLLRVPTRGLVGEISIHRGCTKS